ncbi:prolactin regulatory element-binding protein-like protein, partial [Dinothrombium tinctorium]
RAKRRRVSVSMAGGRKKGYLLARVNFPLYAVKTVSERHVLVAGGGGMAKTGISNTFEIYELVYDKAINACKAVRVSHFDTGIFFKRLRFAYFSNGSRCILGSRAIMCAVVFKERNHFVLASGGIDGMCTLYRMKYAVNGIDKTHASHLRASALEDNRERRGSLEGLRRRRFSSQSSVKDEKENDANKANQIPIRRANSSEAKQDDDEIPNIGFKITPIASFQTDFNNRESEEPFVKVIRFSNAKNVLVIGGADGHIRCWNCATKEKILDIAAHNDEVDDIDIDPQGNTIVSVSRDGHGYAWNVKTGTKICELEYILPTPKNIVKPIKYNFRGIRYGVVENNMNNFKIFTILNPVVRQKPPHLSYLCKWDSKKYITEKIVPVGAEVLSAMTISDDGRFVGIGSLSGTIYVYISFSLQKLYHMPRAHNIFVTGVEFLQTCRETQNLTGDKDASLISISVDNHIVAHHIPKQETIGFLGSSAMLTITLLIVYILLDLLGL